MNTDFESWLEEQIYTVYTSDFIVKGWVVKGNKECSPIWEWWMIKEATRIT